MSIFDSLRVPMQKVSHEVMAYVTNHYPHEPSTIGERVHLRHLQTTSLDHASNGHGCGVWGGSSPHQWVFDSMWETYVPAQGEPQNKTPPVMYVYALGKIEHEYYNNGFGNLDLYDNSCPMYARREFSWDYWQMLQFLYSVSPSVREVLLILKRRRERFQCELDECDDE